jgi:hypothetical protein
VNLRSSAGGRAGHGHYVFIHIYKALACRDKRSRADRRAIGDLVNDRRSEVTHVNPAARIGDDRQVSPSAAFLSIANIERLRENFLSDFPFRSQVEPGASLYDLARVVFPDRFVMLKEHFRCVGSGSI